MSVKRLFGAILWLCLVSPLASQAGPYSNLYVFGDSLSDGGSDYALSASIRAASGGAFPLVPGAPADFQGHFGNGRVAVEYLASSLGLALTPHYLSAPFLGGATGGNNYAQGGATSGLINAAVPGSITIGGNTVSTGFKGVTAQIADYLAVTPHADPNAAYVVWSGANDFLFLGSTPAAPGCSGGVVAVAVCTAVTNVATAVTTLAALGATHIVVPNLPDLGLTASSIAGGPAAMAQGHAISVAYDTGLAAALAGLSSIYTGDIVPFDVFGLFNEILASPASFGFSNTTLSCLSGSVSDATSTVTAACAVAGPDHYLFWDGVHPTTAAQAIIGQRLAAALGVPEPADLALLALGLMALVVVRGRRGAMRMVGAA